MSSDPLPLSVQSDSESLHPKKPASSAGAYFEPLLDTDEAAAIMRIHPKTLQKFARRGLVRGVHVGKLWRFRASEIEAWIQRQLAS
jgi:excisionase family DNA binding protein